MHGHLYVKFKILKVLNEDMYWMLECYCLLPVIIITFSNLYICLIAFTNLQTCNFIC